MQRRAVCLALVATVVFRVPMMRLGDATDADNAISPLDVVASQLVLPVEHGANGAKRNKAQAEGDPGDLFDPYADAGLITVLDTVFEQANTIRESRCEAITALSSS